MLPTALASADPQLPEYEIKAAFLYHFGKFIEWPEETKGIPRPEFFQICILGDDPFGKSMNAFQGKTIRAQKVLVSRIASIDEISENSPCRILYVSPSEKNDLSAILIKVKGYPVLTVADQKDGADAGAMINLITLDQRVRFEINLKAALNAGIQINSKLLKLAVQIKE
jgi:hypothetical protein